uniref:Uncharacterized protein n=1 Tax=Ciona savignyi TaxID=51511 RepID=H2ZG14_CIOSA
MDIKLLLQLVHVFIFQVPSACLHHFRFKHRLIEVLFTLFSETEHGIYMVASAISEELLLYCSLEKNPTLFSLKSIQTLPNIVCNLKDGPLSHFHHIISSVLSDPELTAPSVSLEQHDQWLNDTSTSQIVDSNQEVLFRLPNHFEKICANSCRPVSSVGRSIELLAHVLGRTINILDFEESDAQFMERFGSSNSYFSQVTMLNDAVNRADLLLI